MKCMQIPRGRFAVRSPSFPEAFCALRSGRNNEYLTIFRTKYTHLNSTCWWNHECGSHPISLKPVTHVHPNFPKSGDRTQLAAGVTTQPACLAPAAGAQGLVNQPFEHQHFHQVHGTKPCQKGIGAIDLRKNATCPITTGQVPANWASRARLTSRHKLKPFRVAWSMSWPGVGDNAILKIYDPWGPTVKMIGPPAMVLHLDVRSPPFREQLNYMRKKKLIQAKNSQFEVFSEINQKTPLVMGSIVISEIHDI